MTLLGAVLSDTVILNSPTTTERDRAAIEYLQRVLELEANEFGREMFEATSDVSEVDAEEIVTRDVKVYTVGGGKQVAIAQVETVGEGLLERREELVQAMDEVRERRDYSFYALMITDIIAKGTKMVLSGDGVPVERIFGEPAQDGTIDLPGVMSRKKQVAPELLSAL
jgi:manganese-dependent inorganic pyrophosphatase